MPQGSVECTRCQRGEGSNYERTECIICPKGYYSPEEGSECLPCLNNTGPNCYRDTFRDFSCYRDTFE